MKECTACHCMKDASEFSLDRGRLRSRCRRCAADAERARALANPEAVKAAARESYRRNAERACAYQRTYRSENRDKLRDYFRGYRQRRSDITSAAQLRWNASNPEKRRAHSRLWEAIRAGSVVQQSACEVCASTMRVEAHHDDYAKPLSVRWLCKVCHVAADRQRQQKEVA
ncbi:MAG: hypothetical protein IT356_03490 [Gemmatimonadaceae bacterium]|nr:hypothetical protein [Gemmatimonadaceae bacterium]